MTRRQRTMAEAKAIRTQLMDIIRDIFANNGDVVLHTALAMRHVVDNKSVSAAEDVTRYGGVAVARLRRDEGLAIVPITKAFAAYQTDLASGGPSDETFITNAIAGSGAGGPPIGWYQPSSKDDWLWIYYIGHLASSGMGAVFHAAKQVAGNKQLNGPKTLGAIGDVATKGIPAPPDKYEMKLLEERLTQKP